MHLLIRAARWLFTRLSAVVVLLAVVDRARRWWHRGARVLRERRSPERALLPSLYDLYPAASSAPRRPVGLRTVPLDRIVGTTRHPSQNTADFLPLPKLRGANWRARWQRINRAMDRLALLPPVDLVQVGEDYFVEDGHNRVAAARQAGGIDIDADVTQLVVPGVTTPVHGRLDGSTLIGAEEVRQAGLGRRSRTVEQRSASDVLTREELLRETKGSE